MIDTFKDFIGQNWLSTSISIGAVVYAIYEARRRRGPMLAYQFTGQRLIGTKRNRLPEEVQIIFAGVPVKNLTQTQLIIWNNGDAPLRSDDVPDHDPISFSFGSGSQVLLAEVVKISRDVNRIETQFIAGESNNISLKFGFLDKDDGALISVWHNSDDPMPDVSGTILGQKSGPVSYGRILKFKQPIGPMRPSKPSEKLFFDLAQTTQPYLYSAMPITAVVVGLLALALPFAAESGFPLIPVFPVMSQESGYLLFAFGATYLGVGLFMLHMKRRRFPEELTPDEFLSGKPQDDLTQTSPPVAAGSV